MREHFVFLGGGLSENTDTTDARKLGGREIRAWSINQNDMIQITNELILD